MGQIIYSWPSQEKTKFRLPDDGKRDYPVLGVLFALLLVAIVAIGWALLEGGLL